MDTTGGSTGEIAPGGGLSESAARVADWLRDLTRTAKTARLYGMSNTILLEARAAFAGTTDSLLDELGQVRIQVAPDELHYDDQPLVRPPRRGPARGESAQRLLGELPGVLYRDGVRCLSVRQGIPRRDLDALIDALAMSWTEHLRADDLVTALWQANPTHIEIESAPPEQTLYVANGAGTPDTAHRGFGLGFGLPPAAGEIQGDLGDRLGAVGLQRESGLEQTPIALYLSPRRGYESLAQEANAQRERFVRAWQEEKTADWRDVAVDLLARVRASEPGPATDQLLARFAATGVGNAIARGEWTEAIELLALGRRMGDDASFHACLDAELGRRGDAELGEALDESCPAELDAFFRLTIALGPAGVQLALGAIAGAKRARTRAAASAALTFLCADAPDALAGVLCDRSSETVCHVVTILGHIGGRAVAPLCAQAAHHPDPAVTREVARIVPAIGEPERDDIVLALLETGDTQTLLLTLRSAGRTRNRRIAERIAQMIDAPRFDDRPEEERRTLFQGLSDVGDQQVVPFLEAQLTQGGWFARPSWRRSAAAHALQRIGDPEAAAVLARGRNSTIDAVRAACREVGAPRSA
jgi:HEAT repeat protein